MSLSPEIARELHYFCAMVCYGVVISFCYHLLLFFRAVVRHGTVFVDAEDILFCLAAGFTFFLTAYGENYGILRWYAFAGAGIGCLAYVRTLGASLEGARKWLLQKYGKTATIKCAGNRKRPGTAWKLLQNKAAEGQVSVDEGSSPEHKSKKKKRS